MSTDAMVKKDPAPAPGEEPKPVTSKVPALPGAFNPDDAVTLYMDVAVFAQLQRIARLMCSAGLVPAHLRGDDKISDCVLVVAQAFRWRMDPFAIAQHTFVSSGKLGYEGKLIAAVVNTHSSVTQRLDYAYSGEGQDRKVVVFGRLRGEEKDRTVDGRVRDWATTNEQWKKNPDQMLAYRGAREWARRHVPEAVLGVLADEEVVELERQVDGAYSSRPKTPKTLEALTERLVAEAQTTAEEPPLVACSVCKEGIEKPSDAVASADGFAHAKCLKAKK